jgi:hypothetical protein
MDDTSRKDGQHGKWMTGENRPANPMVNLFGAALQSQVDRSLEPLDPCSPKTDENGRGRVLPSR